ncbi:DUF3784 domain-containing protein [Rubrolithibacter danxiaensis]|uniref:DUF3784 domain-containing protein n=1 Tax=Rubrolithibacter danxiaensis TaxID=3390805 RepID=UPI003BF87034
MIFLLAGFLVNKENAKYILSGYNTMSEEERRKYNLEAFLIFYRHFHLFLSVSLLVTGLLLDLFYKNAGGIFIVLYPLLCYCYFIWRAQAYNLNKSKVKRHLTNGVIFLLLFAIFSLAALFCYSMSQNTVLIKGNVIEITGMYGESLQSNRIRSVEIVHQLPGINFKTNGFALGDYKKGNFRTQTGKVVTLLVDETAKPYLKIVTDKKEIFLSSSKINAADLYHKLNKSIPKYR